MEPLNHAYFLCKKEYEEEDPSFAKVGWFTGSSLLSPAAVFCSFNFLSVNVFVAAHLGFGSSLFVKVASVLLYPTYLGLGLMMWVYSYMYS